MAVITIASAALADWDLSSDVQLRIYAQQPFTALDGTLVPQGSPSEDASQNNNFFQSVACTLSGTTLTIAACTLESTTDSPDNPGALYSAWLFTTEGQRIAPFHEFQSFSLPASPTSTTWAAIALAQGGTP
jgi:hypothetical protein